MTYTYDPADHLTTALYGSALTQIAYDIAGRKLSLDDPDMGLWSYAYDALSNLTRQTDARGQRICLYYDGLNRLTGNHYRADDACPSSPTYNVSYGYDAGTYGKLHRTSMSDASGSTSWSFDQRGRAITETRNLTGIGTFNTAWSYNSADLLAGMQYPENNSGGLSTQVASTYLPQMALDTLGSYVTGTTYDAAGRIVSRLLGSSGLRQDFAYTAWNTQYQGGKLDTIKAGTAPNYNNLQNLDYGYDKVGNILTILDATNSSQKQCFTYDALNRLTRGTTTNDSDPAKQCGTTQLGNGNYDQSYTYDAATGNLGSKAGVGYTYGEPAHDHAVTQVDDDSGVTSKTITIRARKIGMTTHPNMILYIDGQQVGSWVVSNKLSYANFTTSQSISNNEKIDILCSNCSQDVWLDIDYLTVGTQTVQAEGPATLLDLGVDEEAFDWLNISKPTSGVMNEPGALRFVAGSNAFSGNYDVNGNLLYRIVNNLATIMSYDAENRLVSVSGAASAIFVYDGDGNRVKSTINGVTTAFIGNHTEWDVASSSLTRYYYAGSTRVAMRKNNTVYYLLSDHLGSTSLTTDQNGQNPVKQYYLPWGEVRFSSGSLQTKYTYTGQYSNVTDFGLMYYNARWYDNALSRWTQPDIIIPEESQGIQAWDRYAYANNNPIKYNDPTGHDVGCGGRDASECASNTIMIIACGVNDGPCGYNSSSMHPAYDYALKNNYQVFFFDPDDEKYNGKQTKYDIAQDIASKIKGGSDNNFYIIGFSAGADATILATEMAGFANNIQGIGLIDPYLNYTDPLGEIENLQMQADQIFTNGIKIALADSPGDNTTVSIAGAIVPNPPFTYSHNEMGAAKDVFNFIFSQIME